ncbi:MAG TPA: thiamine pyrophosphate-dependent enzyme [Terriglobales bacterium]|nr:thiamine pyrophosphate-dependent enzyme [Terriglobales bacterium]
MSTAPTSAAPITVVLESPLPPEVLTHLYETMLKARLLAKRFRNAPHTAEAVLAGTLQNTETDDLLITSHSHPVLEVLKGADVDSVARPVSASKSANKLKIDLVPPPLRVAVAGPDSAPSVAAGSAFALKRSQSSAVAIAFLPGKATTTKAFEQAARFAGEQRLPVIFVADWSQSRASRSHEGTNLSHWPCPTIAVDARDVIAVYRVMKEATGVARRGHGPTLVDCVNFLAPGRRGRDDRDPIATFRGYLKRHHAWSDEWAAKLESDLKLMVRGSKRQS